MERLYEDLNNLCNKLHKKYDINYGGCCYVAYLIADNLEKHKIPFKLVMFDHGYYYFDKKKLEMRKLIRNRNKNFAGNTHSHYCIQVDSGILNEGSFNRPGYVHITLGCLKSKDIKFLYKYGSWNSDYDSRLNELIGFKINKLFNDYFSRG